MSRASTAQPLGKGIRRTGHLRERGSRGSQSSETKRHAMRLEPEGATSWYLGQRQRWAGDGVSQVLLMFRAIPNVDSSSPRVASAKMKTIGEQTSSAGSQFGFCSFGSVPEPGGSCSNSNQDSPNVQRELRAGMTLRICPVHPTKCQPEAGTAERTSPCRTELRDADCATRDGSNRRFRVRGRTEHTFESNSCECDSTLRPGASPSLLLRCHRAGRPEQPR